MLGFIISFFPWIGGVWMVLEAIFGNFGDQKIESKFKKKIIAYGVGSIITDCTLVGVPISTAGKLIFRRQLLNEIQGKKGLISNPLKNGPLRSIINQTPIGRAINIGTKISSTITGDSNKKDGVDTEQNKPTSETKRPITSSIPEKPEQSINRPEPKNANRIPSKKTNTQDNEETMSSPEQTGAWQSGMVKKPIIPDMDNAKKLQLVEKLEKSKSLADKMALAKYKQSNMIKNEEKATETAEEQISEKLKKRMPKMYSQMEERLMKDLPKTLSKSNKSFNSISIPSFKMGDAHRSIVDQINK